MASPYAADRDAPAQTADASSGAAGEGALRSMVYEALVAECGLGQGRRLTEVVVKAIGTPQEQWQITHCKNDGLRALLADGWEPFAVDWVKQDRLTEVVRYWLKRRHPTIGDAGASSPSAEQVGQ